MTENENRWQVTTDTIQVRYAAEANTSCCLSCGSSLDLAEVQKEEIIVDLGSGRGAEVLKAATKASHAYGIDFTEEMIETAKASAEKLEMKNAEFIYGAIDKIPLPDDSVHVVISNCTINHAQDKQKVYSEICRIMKPGGRFVVSDIIAEKQIPADIANDPEAIAGCYGGAITKEPYFDAISSAGFSEIEILEESLPYDKSGVSVISLTLKGYK